VQNAAHALRGRVGVALGVVGQQLGGAQGAVRGAGDDVGEGAAPVDPEAPAAHAATSFMETDGSASLARSTGVDLAISCLPIMNSGGALTASTARTRSPLRWKTANLAVAGSPRTIRSSASNG